MPGGELTLLNFIEFQNAGSRKERKEFYLSSRSLRCIFLAFFA
jgi:hypothetical protein